MAPRQQREKKSSTLDDVLKGLQAASMGINAVGGIAKLVPTIGALAGTGGASESEAAAASQRHQLAAMRSQFAQGGLEGGLVRPAQALPTEPATEAGWKKKTGLLQRVGAQGGRVRKAQAPRAAEPQVPAAPAAPRTAELELGSMTRRGGKEGWYRDIAAKHEDLTPEMVKEQILAENRPAYKRGERGTGWGANEKFAFKLPGAAPAPPAEAQPQDLPAREGQSVYSVEAIQEAIEAARAHGNADEVGRWAARKVLAGQMKIEGATESQLAYIEQVKGQQDSYEEKRRAPIKDFPTDFRAIAGRIVGSDSPSEVRNLLSLAAEIQPHESWLDRQAGTKGREMERIEMLADKRLNELGDGMPQLDLKRLANLKYEDARADYWTDKSKPLITRGASIRKPDDVSPLLTQAKSHLAATQTKQRSGPGASIAKAQAAYSTRANEAKTLNARLRRTGLLEGATADQVAAVIAEMPTKGQLTAALKETNRRYDAVLNHKPKRDAALGFEAQHFGPVRVPALKFSGKPGDTDEGRAETAANLKAFAKSLTSLPKEMGDLTKLKGLLENLPRLKIASRTRTPEQLTADARAWGDLIRDLDRVRRGRRGRRTVTAEEYEAFRARIEALLAD